MKIRSTRKDVAKEAGVSTATVSYYINKSGYVSKATQEKIQVAIDKLEYQPNLLAKSLKEKDSKQIVFICNEIRNPFHAEIAVSLGEEAYKNGLMTIFCNAVEDEDFVLKICSYMVSGVFIASGRIATKTINKIAQLQIPVVVLDPKSRQNLDPKVKKIQINYNQVSDDIATLVAQRDKPKLAYISSTTRVEGKFIDSKSMALFESLKKNGVSLEDSRCLEGFTHTQAVFELGESLFTGENPSNFVICSNDSVAMGMLHVAQQMGLKVPKDVGIIGYDNTVYAQITHPTLTTVDLSVYELGRIALEMITNKGKQEDTRNIFPSLVIRGST